MSWRGPFGRPELDDEADVVVVGSGAGGAPAAMELAGAGLRVVLIEEGKRHDPDLFRRGLPERIRSAYRNGGGYPALGRPALPVLVGVGVGGSTTVSNGTCFRPPAEVLRRWRACDGLASMDAEAIGAHVERVERLLEIREVPEAIMGRSSALLRGAARDLGWSGGPILRYAPACRGSGVCCFGCPTGAKRSADLSYVPMALDRGARLHTELRAERVLVERGRAAGVLARFVGGPDRGRLLRVRAGTVVLACGALFTPLLLARSGLAVSRELGRNLRLQPCVKLMARMDAEVRPWEGVPQAYSVDQFRDRGFLIESIQVPAAIGASSLPGIGEAHRERMADYGRVASLVAIVRDEGSGRVLAGPRGGPILRYELGDTELARIREAVARMGELLLAAGARELFPPLPGAAPIDRRGGASALAAAMAGRRDVLLVSYHPMGTARMGIDAGRGVVDGDGQVHGALGVYVSDASALPTALGCNPQLTIMALSTRLAAHLVRRAARARAS